jgi:hypothetical protein
MQRLFDDRPRRRLIVGVLLVVGCLAALLANLAVWARVFAYDSDEFVAALEPLASDEEVLDGIADELVDRVMGLQPGDDSALRDLVELGLHDVLRSDAFEPIFIEAVRVAHDQLVSLAEGDREQAVLDLDDVLGRLDSVLQGMGRDVLSETQIEKIDDIVVKTRGRLDTALRIVDAVEKGAIVLPVVAATAFAAAIAFSSNRRRTLAQAGMAVAVAMVVTFGLLWVGRGEVTDRVDDNVYSRAVGDVWDGVTASLKTQTGWILGIALAVALLAWGLGRFVQDPHPTTESGGT